MINKRLAKLESLSSEANRFWNHIYSDSYDFLQGRPIPTLLH
jgi:insulysin